MKESSLETALPAAIPTVEESQKSKATVHIRVYGALLLGVFGIAFSSIFVRWANVPGTVSALYRVIIATTLLAVPFARRVAHGQVVCTKNTWLLVGGAGLFFSLDLAIWNISLFQTSVTTATLLVNCAPIMVGLGAVIIFRERLRLPYWLGLTLALTGITLIVGYDAFSNAHIGTGDVLALLAGVFYAAYLLVTQRLRTRLDTLASLWLTCAISAIILVIADLMTQRLFWGFSLQTYLALLGLGIISQVIAWLALNYVLGHLPAAMVSVALLGQPVLTALLAIPLLHEGIDLRQCIGGIIVLIGIYLVNRGVNK